MKKYYCGKKLIDVGLLKKSVADNNKMIIGTKIYESNELNRITLEDIINDGVFELVETET